MALSKSIAKPSGLVVPYWNIGSKQEHIKDKSYSVTVFGYLSEAARRDGNEPEDAKTYQVAVGDDYEPDLTRAQIYPLLKAMPEFEDATDI